MMPNISIIPLAITVMLGPQILVPMLLITRKDPIKSSLAYIISLSLTLVLLTFFYYYIISVTHMHEMSLHGKPLFKYFLVGLLLFLIIRTIGNRKKLTKPPKWMADITNASLKKVTFIGFLLIALMPGDVAVTFTVASFLDTNHVAFMDVFPFFALVCFIASIPLFVYLSFGKKGNQLMATLDKWLNTHGYLVNIITFSVFIYLILS